MATWTLTGTPVSATNSDLMANVALDGAQPGDFNPAAVTSIAVAWTLTVTGQQDDTWVDHQSANVCSGGGQVIGTALGGADVTRASNGTWPKTGTISSPTVELSPTGNSLRAPSGTWANYTKVKSNDGTAATITAVTVTVTYTPLAGPVASFTTDRQTILVGQAVQFTDTSSGGPTSWAWDFGGGAAASTQRNPLVVFPTAGVYNVTLTASNGAGSSTSPPTTITVQVREAEIWNGAAWVGGESWNGSAWVPPEVWDGSEWVPVKAPA